MPIHATPRFVLVDDTDPSITYSGPGWKTEQRGGLDNIGSNGDTWLHTAHGTSEDGTVSMKFNGSYIQVFATFESVENDTIPAIRCLIDGVEIDTNEPPEDPYNGHKICHSANNDITEDQHDFTIEIKAAPKKTTIWIDQIEYVPTAGLSLENKYITMFAEDRDVLYDTPWGPWDDGDGLATTKIGASAEINFKGIQASFFGWIDPMSPPTTGRGSYTVDGGPPTTFTWTTDPNRTLFNHLYFTTPEYKYGSHQLKATLLGSTSGTSPLTFSYTVIKNGTVPTNQTETLQSGSPSNEQNKRQVGIVGGVLGGVIAILSVLILVGFLWRRRRQNAKDSAHQSSSDPVMQPFIPPTFHTTVSPFYEPTLRPMPITSRVDVNSNINQPPQKLLSPQMNTLSSHHVTSSSQSYSTTTHSSDLWSTGYLNQDSGIRLTEPTDVPPNYTMS